MVAARLEFIVNLLDTRLVSHRRMWIRLARRRFRWVGSTLTGFVVVRLVVAVF